VIRLLHQENKPSCVRPGQAGEISCVSPGLLPSIGATKLLQQRACLDQIGKSEALGERLVDRREQAACLGSRPAIPTKRNEAPVACPPWIYQNRNLVERFWSRVKEWRAVATRYEKTERSFMGVLCMAATMDWLKA
jgi:hypothetical protein